MALNLPAGMQITAPVKPEWESILTTEALEFVAKLRDELKFPDLPSLTEQMQRDAETARRLLSEQRLRATA